MKSKKEIKEEIFGLTVSSLPDHVENPGEIIANIIEGTSVLGKLVPMTGAKANTQVQLNILNTDVTWSSADCVSAQTGDNTVITDRYVNVVRLSDREEMCLDLLDSKLGMIQSAGSRNEDLPFAAMYIDFKVNKNSKQLNKLAWQGSIASGTANLALADGWLEIASTETGSLNHYASGEVYNAATAIDVVRANFIANRSEDMIENGDLVVFMSLGNYNTLSTAIIDAFGIAGTGSFLNSGDQNQLGLYEMIFPGSDVVIKGDSGLPADAMFSTTISNLRYATDLESDRESVELFYDRYHNALVSNIVFAIGFQYEFPEMVTMIDGITAA